MMSLFANALSMAFVSLFANLKCLQTFGPTGFQDSRFANALFYLLSMRYSMQSSTRTLGKLKRQWRAEQELIARMFSYQY